MPDHQRFSRHLGLFGEVGQAKLTEMDLTVVGASGLGTPTLLYLVFFGPRRIRIIEPGYLKDSGRNRNFAARNSDASVTTRKVDIAARMVRWRSPDTAIAIIPERLESTAAFEAIEQSDWVFGCVDKDGARFVLNEVCLAFDKPLIDMASDVQTDSKEFGGRVTVVRPGHGCLHCLDILDQNDVRHYLSTEGELANEAAAYGVPMDQLAPKTGPSVATINGIVAGLGVTEFWVEVTGFRTSHRSITYLGSEAALRRTKDVGGLDCYYCQIVRGAGRKSGVSRHIIRVDAAA